MLDNVLPMATATPLLVWFKVAAAGPAVQSSSGVRAQPANTAPTVVSTSQGQNPGAERSHTQDATNGTAPRTAIDTSTLA
jgi:hypothetical protein